MSRSLSVTASPPPTKAVLPLKALLSRDTLEPCSAASPPPPARPAGTEVLPRKAELFRFTVDEKTSMPSPLRDGERAAVDHRSGAAQGRLVAINNHIVESQVRFEIQDASPAGRKCGVLGGEAILDGQAADRHLAGTAEIAAIDDEYASFAAAT